MKKYLIGSILLVFVVITLAWWAGRVTHLDPPLVKPDKIIVSKQMLLTGVAYPNAQIVVYIDGQFTQNIQVLSNGTFQESIPLSKEGTTEIKAKQIYGNVSSEFSEPLLLQVDLTPPDKNSLRITSNIPTFSKNLSLAVVGRADPLDKVFINGILYPVANDGSFSGVETLVNGENILNFSLGDVAGNTTLVETHKVVVDGVPPKVITSYCGSKTLSGSDFANLSAGQEYVCLTTGQWEDWQDPAPIPIVGFVIGDIGSITVNGKIIYPDENDEIYQRVYLPVPKGLNKYKVVVTDKYGNKTSTSLTMTVQSVRSSGYDEVIDRLDDIESQL